MAQNSNIEWTETTWNPLAGCTRASAGCDNCYAAKMSLRLEAMAEADIAAGKDPGGKRKYIGIATKNSRGVPVFNGRINLDYDELQRPFRWKKPRLVFVNSMSDLFHKDVPERFILDSFNVMKANKQHTFQVLTKRPDRMADFSQRYCDGLPNNVWAGTSVEDQKAADERIPDLLRVRAAVRFLSCEPLLGPVDLTEIAPTSSGGIDALSLTRWEDVYEGWRDTSPTWQDDFNYYFNFDEPPTGLVHPGIQWVIVGGESGNQARPMNPQWARNIRDQCQAAAVPYFFKQWGEWLPVFEPDYLNHPGVPVGRFWHKDDPGNGGEKVDIGFVKGQIGAYGVHMQKVGKKAAGRLLDGREWNEMPVTAPTRTEGGDYISS